MAETRSNIRRRQPDARLLAGFDRSRRQLSTNTKIIKFEQNCVPKIKILIYRGNFAGSRLVNLHANPMANFALHAKTVANSTLITMDVLRVSTIFFKILVTRANFGFWCRDNFGILGVVTSVRHIRTKFGKI